jgi:hypothetical protein
MTKREFAAQKTAERLTAAIDALRSSEGWQRYLKTRSTFRKYSFRNTILIAMQKPDATYVAGASKWRDLNRHIKKGANAIWILAPSIRRTTNENIEPDEDGVRRVLGFRNVKVFDITDTQVFEGQEDDFDTSIIDNRHVVAPDTQAISDQMRLLEQFAELQNHTVAYEAVPGSARGFQRPATNEIVIDPAYPMPDQLGTLVHEIAHALGVSYEEYGRKTAETIAESTAFIVLDHLGYNADARSVPYVAGWTDAPQEQLAEFAKAAAMHATLILDFIDPEEPCPDQTSSSLEGSTTVTT